MSEGRSIRAVVAALAALVVVSVPAVAQASGGVSVASMWPDHLGQGGTREVTVTGGGFTQGTVTASVSGTGVAVTGIDVLTPSSFIASVSAAAGATLGARALTVEVAGAGSDTLADALTVDASPTITSVSPSHVLRGHGPFTFTLAGTGFEQGMRASITGSSAGDVAASVTSATTATVTASFSLHALLGPHTTTLLNPDAGYVVDATAPVVDGPPNATGLSIGSLDRDETALVTVTGHGFLPGARVDAGPGIAATVRSVAASSITVSLHAGKDTPIGHHAVTVRNPDGGTTRIATPLWVDYQPILYRWAVGDGASDWSVTLRRPTFVAPPSFAFSGRGVTASTARLNQQGQAVVELTVGPDAHPTWRTMTITDGTTRWDVPRGLKVRRPPVILHVPSLAQGASYVTVTATGQDFEVCPRTDPVVSVSGSGVTVNLASPALGNLMYLNLSVAATAAVGPRDVTMTNCDSGGTWTSVGVFTVTAG